MKKLLFVFTTLLIFSCSSSSDDNNSSNSDFHPPTWIQGTWVRYPFNDPKREIEDSYKFLENDILEFVGNPNSASITNSYKEDYKSAEVNEEYYSNKYVIIINYSILSTKITERFYFFKISNTTFKFNNEDDVNGSSLIYNKIN